MHGKEMTTNNLKIVSIIFFLLISFSYGQNLKPGDGIKISFYNVDEQIHGEYFIQDNGRIHLPYIGMINAQSNEFADIQSSIISEYSKIYKNPEITVQPLIRVNIIGEVGKPGVYYLTGFETITDLISLAGGETNDSNIENVMILRNDSQLDVDLESFLRGKNSLNDIGIESGDKVYLPRTWWVRARDVSIVVSGVAALVAIAGLFSK
jgi:protein involved in polysaccharide export with SLBB domain